MTFEQRLINLVKEYELLYNPEHPQFSKKPLRTAAWVEIAQKMDSNKIACKTKWRTLRDTYKKLLIKIEAAGGVYKYYRRKWQYLSLISFVNKYEPIFQKHKGEEWPILVDTSLTKPKKNMYDYVHDTECENVEDGETMDKSDLVELQNKGSEPNEQSQEEDPHDQIEVLHDDSMLFNEQEPKLGAELTQYYNRTTHSELPHYNNSPLYGKLDQIIVKQGVNIPDCNGAADYINPAHCNSPVNIDPGHHYEGEGYSDSEQIEKQCTMNQNEMQQTNSTNSNQYSEPEHLTDFEARYSDFIQTDEDDGDIDNLISEIYVPVTDDSENLKLIELTHSYAKSPDYDSAVMTHAHYENLTTAGEILAGPCSIYLAQLGAKIDALPVPPNVQAHLEARITELVNDVLEHYKDEESLDATS